MCSYIKEGSILMRKIRKLAGNTIFLVGLQKQAKEELAVLVGGKEVSLCC